MALKAVLATKAELDALPEAVRALYKEDNGKFVLDVDGGLVPQSDVDSINAKLAEFRTNNVALLKKLEDFKDIDPAEARRLKTELETLRANVNDPNRNKDKDADLAARIEAAVMKATKPLTDKVDGLTAERDAAKKALDEKLVEDALWKVGAAAGVREEARGFWLSEAKKVFRQTDAGELIGFKGDQQMPSQRKNRGHEPLTAEEWALEIAPKTPSLAILYKDSKGAGAQQQNIGPGGARIVSAQDGQAVSANLESIAKGTVMVQQ